MDKTTQAQMWQQLRDTASFNFTAEQTERDRMINVVNAALANESFMTDGKFASQRASLFNMLNSAAGSVTESVTGTPVTTPPVYPGYPGYPGMGPGR